MVFFLLIISAILSVKLFFKVWGMCDNVAEITKTICNSDATTETQEQITEQNSPTISSRTNENHNIETLVIIAYVLCAIIYLIFMIMKMMNNP